jgi:hypothetical protein
MHNFFLLRTITLCTALLFLNGCSLPNIPAVIQELPADRNDTDNSDDPDDGDITVTTGSDNKPVDEGESDPEALNSGEGAVPEDKPVGTPPGKEDSPTPVNPGKTPETTDPGKGAEDPAGPEKKPETTDPGKGAEDPVGPEKKPEDTPALPMINGAGDLAAYLGQLPDNTKDTPYGVRVSGFDLSSAEKSGNTLWTLYAALSRFVVLDISACTGDSFANISATKVPNKEKIVSLILPGTVNTLRANAFSGSNTLVSAVLPGVITIEKGAFANCENLTSIDLPLVKTLGGGEANPKDGVFYNCAALTEVYLPEVITIGDYAFDACKALTLISMPRAKSLGSYALKECIALVSVSLPETSFIGNQAFYGCAKLISIFLPSAVSIGKEACYNCPLLESVTLGDTPPVLEGLVFPKTNLKTKIRVPQAAIEDYKTTEGWADLKDKLLGI